MIDLTDFDIPTRINELQHKYTVTLWELAQKTGLHYTTLKLVMKGQSRPSLYTFITICNAFEITPNEFFKV